MKKILLVPGFGASDLTDTSGQIRWFDTAIAPVLGIGALRLDSTGMAPEPPDGLPLQVSGAPQDPWGPIVTQLRAQLDPSVWSLQAASYDWRLNLITTAQQLAANVVANATPGEPMTLVGHSAGGLVSVLAWSVLNVQGKSNLVRRVITICSPFQGSYAPQQWLAGTDPSIQQLTDLSQIPGLPTQYIAMWALGFLNGIALTWPSFYQLMPSLVGSEALRDPFRFALFKATNYSVGAPVSQAWLDSAKNGFQPGLALPATYPPDWCLTAVVSSGISTAFRLVNGALPLQLGNLIADQDGDGVVTAGSQTPPQGQIVNVSGSHSSVPLGIAVTGLLAQLITDPRGPLSPPAPDVTVPVPIMANVTAPPESSYITGLQCIGGG
jgi:pimeloyl-ACP methyl ester carboxylesterase